MSKLIEFARDSYKNLILHEKAQKPWVIFRFQESDLPSKKELFEIIRKSCNKNNFSYYVEVIKENKVLPEKYLIGTWVRHVIK